jgi:hypothetical protein
VRIENGGEQRTSAAPYIDDMTRAGPVVAAGCIGEILRPGGHGRVEGGTHLGMGGQVGPERYAEDRLPGRLPGAKGVQQTGEGKVHLPTEPFQVQVQPHPGRVIRTQQARNVVEPECPRVRLAEYAVADQVTQQPPEGIRIGWPTSRPIHPRGRAPPSSDRPSAEWPPP